MECRGPILFTKQKMRILQNMLMGMSQRKHTGPRQKVGSEGVDELNFQKIYIFHSTILFNHYYCHCFYSIS